MTPPSRSASASASADLPLAVGPAIRMVPGRVTPQELADIEPRSNAD